MFISCHYDGAGAMSVMYISTLRLGDDHWALATALDGVTALTIDNLTNIQVVDTVGPAEPAVGLVWFDASHVLCRSRPRLTPSCLEVCSTIDMERDASACVRRHQAIALTPCVQYLNVMDYARYIVEHSFPLE